jgi:hypothetical protein
MIKIFFIIILLLSPWLLWAQDKTCNEAGSTTDLHFPVQDQDGLGTCYANSVSLLIQASLGLENPPSYQQLALMYSVDKGDNKNLINQDEGKDTYAAEGGLVCDTFNAAKYYGFCDARSFNLDVFGAEDGMQKQKKLIMGYGKLIDDLGRNTKIMDDKKWNALRQNLIGQIYNKKKDCGDSKEDFFRRKVVEKLPRMVLKRISGCTEYKDQYSMKKDQPGIAAIFDKNEQELLLWEKIRDTQLKSQKTNDGGVAWSLNNDVSNSITSDLISEWIKGTVNLKPKSYFNYDEILTPDVTSPTSLLFKNLLGPLSPFDAKESQQSEKEESGRGLIFEVAQEWEICTVDIDDKMLSTIHLENLINVNQCLASSYQSLLDPAVISASKIADDLINKLKEKKLKDYNNRALALMDIFSPQCRLQSQQNSSKLLNKFCLSHNPKNLGDSDRMILPKMRKLITANLCKNSPVSISVCTQFMSDDAPNIDTQFCNNQTSEANENKKHGNHALTIVGHKIDSDNSTRYLVQNSWGQTCGVVNPKAKGVDCEIDSSGKTTGRFWISENLLLKNTFEMNTID